MGNIATYWRWFWNVLSSVPCQSKQLSLILTVRMLPAELSNHCGSVQERPPNQKHGELLAGYIMLAKLLFRIISVGYSFELLCHYAAGYVFPWLYFSSLLPLEWKY